MPKTPQNNREFNEFVEDYITLRDQRRGQVIEMMQELGWDVETWDDVEKILYAVALHEIEEEGDADKES